jgi:hypothetical protein
VIAAAPRPWAKQQHNSQLRRPAVPPNSPCTCSYLCTSLIIFFFLALLSAPASTARRPASTSKQQYCVPIIRRSVRESPHVQDSEIVPPLPLTPATSHTVLSLSRQRVWVAACHSCHLSIAHRLCPWDNVFGCRTNKWSGNRKSTISIIPPWTRPILLTTVAEPDQLTIWHKETGQETKRQWHQFVNNTYNTATGRLHRCLEHPKYDNPSYSSTATLDSCFSRHPDRDLQPLESEPKHSTSHILPSTKSDIIEYNRRCADEEPVDG